MPSKIRMPTDYYLKNRFNTQSYMFKEYLEEILTRRGAFYLPIEKLKYKKNHPHFSLSAGEQMTLLKSKNWNPPLIRAALGCYTNRPELGVNFDSSGTVDQALKAAPFAVIAARYPDTLAVMLVLAKYEQGARLVSATRDCIKSHGFGGLRVTQALKLLRKRNLVFIYTAPHTKTRIYELTSEGRRAIK